MGTDIHGHIEIVPYPWSTRWQKIMDISPLAGRNYDVFARLFGVRNYEHYVPVAADRGIPDDADISLFRYEHGDYAKREIGDDPTWISFKEILATQNDIEYPQGWKLLILMMFYLNGHFTPDTSVFEDEGRDAYYDPIVRPCYCRLVVWFDS